jgi:uncharacterized protein (TIGR02246 family)
MKKPMLVGIVAALGLLAPLAQAAQKKADLPGPGDVAMQIQSKLNQFDHGWNAHDPRQMASVFAGDGVYLNPEGQTARGRREIEQAFGREHQAMMSQSTIVERLESLRLLNPDLALADVNVNIANQTDPNGQPLPEQQFHAVILFKKVGDQWQALDARAYKFLEQPPMGVGGSGPALEHQHDVGSMAPCPSE